jgi:hypothetical protein
MHHTNNKDGDNDDDHIEPLTVPVLSSDPSTTLKEQDAPNAHPACLKN